MTNRTTVHVTTDALLAILGPGDRKIIDVGFTDEHTLWFMLEGNDVPHALNSMVEVTRAELTSDRQYVPFQAVISPRN